jgi:hypothetical protein
MHILSCHFPPPLLPVFTLPLPAHLQGVGLCHGIAGNGYALLAMARATQAPHYLRAARAFAMYAAQHWKELYDGPDRPASLFEVRWGFLKEGTDPPSPPCVCVGGGCWGGLQVWRQVVCAPSMCGGVFVLTGFGCWQELCATRAPTS